MGFMKKLGGMNSLPKGKTGKGPSEPMVTRPRSSKPSGKKRSKGMGMMGLSKGPGMKSGKTVKNTKYSSKMSKGMTVPNFQDTVIKKMFTGGITSSSKSNIKLPTGMQPVKRSTPSNKMVGQPKTVGKNKPNMQTPPKIKNPRGGLAGALSAKRGATKSSSAPRSIPKKPKKKTGRGDI